MESNRHFGFDGQDFQAEFATFVGFVGTDIITKALARLAQKLGSVSPLARTLYGERYFLQQQLVRFADQPNAFQLDTKNVKAIRAASYIAGVNRMAELLPARGKDRLRGVLVNALDPDGDARQFEHEIRCFTHFRRQGFTVAFADLDTQSEGRIFDFLVAGPAGEFEVECKTITGEAGLQIKSELTIGLAEAFRKHAGSGRPINKSGLFTLQLHQPAATIKNLANRLVEAIKNDGPLPDERDFTLVFEDKPEWQAAFDKRQFEAIREMIAKDIGEEAYCAVELDGCMSAIVFRQHKPSTLTKNAIEVIKAACKQCSATRPSMVWLHFIGMGQEAFREIVDVSINGLGGGLNAAVSISLHDRQYQPVRTHVERVRFTADVNSLTRRPALAPNLMLTNTVSLDGLLYDVPNPRCVFPPIGNI